MKTTRSRGVGGLSLLLLIGLSLMTLTQDTIALQNDLSESIYPSINDLVEVPEIYIFTDDDIDTWASSGDGSPGNPYIIENYNVTSGGVYGIIIDASGWGNPFNVSFIIRNCVVTANEVCIKIRDAYPNLVRIENCICTGTTGGDGIGIYLVNCAGAVLLDNTCSLNHHTGIKLDSTATAVLTNNTCEQNGDEGIYLDNSSDNCQLYDNKLKINAYGYWNEISHGTHLYYNIIANNSYEGLSIVNSNNLLIENNSIQTNGLATGAALYMSNADGVQIKFNEFIGNLGYAITLNALCDSDVIHHNNFIQNNQGGIQAYEDYTSGHLNATWYDVAIQEGNYWDDYVGPGVYNLAGSCANYDPYPLSSQVLITTIFVPEFNTSLFGIILSLTIFGLAIIFIKRK
jgi:parallel beta-helix repeat protein